MNNLDDLTFTQKIDSANVLGSIQQLGDQCEHAWQEVSSLTFPDQYRKVKSIVFSGMGGSALGAYLVKSLFRDVLKVPFEIINDYHLPPYVTSETLVILGSYSGSTEETISCAKEALARKACVTGLTVGSDLGDFLNSNNFPYYKINPKYNPSNQPRLGTGYSVFGQIALLNSLQFLTISPEEISLTGRALAQGNQMYGMRQPTPQNRTKQLAQKLYGKIPIVVSAEFLGHVGRIVRNQIHETAKSYSDYHILPELNHHLMEGLTNPPTNKDLLAFLFLTSSLYSTQLQKRVKITKDVVLKQGIEVFEFSAQSTSKISQVFESVQFGAYVNYYMAMLYGVDPSKIPWVDYFKSELTKGVS